MAGGAAMESIFCHMIFFILWLSVLYRYTVVG